MNILKFSPIALGLVLLGLGCAQPVKNQASHVELSAGSTIANNGSNQLLLRDFRPQSNLSATTTQVLRAKFPVIDVHTHINDAYHTNGDWLDPTQLVARMDALNIKKIVILTGKWGEELQKVIDYTVKPYPNRFTVYTQLDFTKIDLPNFADLMVAQIEDAVKRGARGLKILKNFGLSVRYQDGSLAKIDDPRFNKIWQACGRLKIPVAIHTSDPVAFFSKVDGSNERYEELNLEPSWSFVDPKYPSKAELLAARDRVFERNPHTTFVALHVANYPENLDYVSKLLRRLPNVAVEFGARQAELGRQPRRALAFFTEFQDRIMFGTDWDFSEALYQNYFRWLESSDEYFKYWDWPMNGHWHIYGLSLNAKILAKIYYKNAQRILGL